MDDEPGKREYESEMEYEMKGEASCVHVMIAMPIKEEVVILPCHLLPYLSCLPLSITPCRPPAALVHLVLRPTLV